MKTRRVLKKVLWVSVCLICMVSFSAPWVVAAQKIELEEKQTDALIQLARRLVELGHPQ